MKKDNQYRLVRDYDANLFICNFSIIVSLIGACLSSPIGSNQWEFVIICLVFALVFCVLALRHYGPKLKAKIVKRYGVRYKGEIIGCKFVKGGGSRLDQYYLEIAYTDSRGRERIHKTLSYHGNPNWYLESTHCSIYEWKGLHVEGDFRVREQMDPFGNIGVYCRKVHFTLR